MKLFINYFKMNLIEHIKSFLQRLNKYWVAVILFLVFTVFIGENTMIDRLKYDREIKQLERDIEVQKKELQANRQKLESIRENDESLEKFAREQYRLTKPDEELFIIEE
ncbi:MAG: septum formation initiator family protein [Dysgonamonadaceae bacterium]|nr:septum formation initiator family protein [Dysgonamonadaceae bacterium]